MSYSQLINQATKEFKIIQKKFRGTYKIDDYENWYYDQASEILTLSTGNDQINFRYIPVGTYSDKSETWMWSWNNEDSIEKSKSQTIKLRVLGEEKQFQKLSEGYFDSHEYEGWEFVAIAHKLLGGIGGYRVQIDHLEKYFLIIGQISNKTPARIKKQTAGCERHGVRRVAFVCRHLLQSERQGFEEAFPTFRGMYLREEDDLQAWCDRCEVERLKTDGWNEESMQFANIELVCEECYFEIKERNLRA